VVLLDVIGSKQVEEGAEVDAAWVEVVQRVKARLKLVRRRAVQVHELGGEFLDPLGI